jgi:hypothetical protein
MRHVNPAAAAAFLALRNRTACVIKWHNALICNANG